jgi:hypothetical protein
MLVVHEQEREIWIIAGPDSFRDNAFRFAMAALPTSQALAARPAEPPAFIIK